MKKKYLKILATFIIYAIFTILTSFFWTIAFDNQDLSIIMSFMTGLITGVPFAITLILIWGEDI